MSELILYTTEDGLTRLDLRTDGHTAWLTQSEIAELFQTTKQNVSLHTKNIFAEGELNTDSVVKDYLTTAADGKCYKSNLYNLDLIEQWLKNKDTVLFLGIWERLNNPNFKTPEFEGIKNES